MSPAEKLPEPIYQRVSRDCSPSPRLPASDGSWVAAMAGFIFYCMSTTTYPAFVTVSGRETRPISIYLGALYRYLYGCSCSAQRLHCSRGGVRTVGHTVHSGRQAHSIDEP
jgi:hypothetical protein